MRTSRSATSAARPLKSAANWRCKRRTARAPRKLSNCHLPEMALANFRNPQFLDFHRLDFPAARGQNRGRADGNARRTEKLETDLAQAKHLVEELNGVVSEQGKLRKRLKKKAQRKTRA